MLRVIGEAAKGEGGEGSLGGGRIEVLRRECFRGSGNHDGVKVLYIAGR